MRCPYDDVDEILCRVYQCRVSCLVRDRIRSPSVTGMVVVVDAVLELHDTHARTLGCGNRRSFAVVGKEEELGLQAVKEPGVQLLSAVSVSKYCFDERRGHGGETEVVS